MLSRFVLSGMLVLMVLASLMFGRSLASSPAQSFSATAAPLIARSGQIGRVALSGEPGICSQKSSTFSPPDGQVSLYHDTLSFVGLTARPGASRQTVEMRTRVYRRLADGSYQFLREDPNPVTATVTDQPVTIPARGSFAVLPAGPDYVLAYLVTWYDPAGTTVDGWALAVRTNYITYLDTRATVDELSMCR